MDTLKTPARRTWRQIRSAVLDFVLPPTCIGCGSAEAGARRLCRLCSTHLGIRSEPTCRRCGEPTPLGECLADHGPLRGLAFARAPFAYAGTGGAMVRRLKLSSEFGALAPLAAAMARCLGSRLDGTWRKARLVPVPLHPRRRRLRGFDQAGLLAAAVAARAGLEWQSLLRRTRATLPQGDPTVTSRERNIEGAFGLRSGGEAAGRRWILVDDVMTSGATARACAAVLRAAGGVEVALLTACRA